MLKKTILLFQISIFLLISFYPKNCMSAGSYGQKYDKYYVFWTETIKKLSSYDADVKLTKNKNYTTNRVTVFDLSYNSMDNVEITGYLSVPVKEGNYPGILCIHGMSGGFKAPQTDIANQGFVVLNVNLRGYEISHGGSSYDEEIILRGITDKDKYIFKNMIMDAYRAVEILYDYEKTDSNYIAVKGISMGGGISLFLAAFNDKINYVLADVPFFCDIQESMKLSTEWPYTKIVDFINKNESYKYTVLNTLSYFDISNVAKYISNANVLITCGNDDRTCPAIPIKNAFEKIKSKTKSIFSSSGRAHAANEQTLKDQLNWLIKKIDQDKKRKELN